MAGEGQKSTFIKFCKNPIILWTVRQYLDGLRMSSERQVLNTKIFKEHCTRSVSTSKAGLVWLPVTEILEKGSWNNASAATWQRFYNRQVESSAEKYQNKVLS